MRTFEGVLAAASCLALGVAPGCSCSVQSNFSRDRTGEVAAETTTESGIAVGLVTCERDADCVAVPKNDCCWTGELVAINTGGVHAYNAGWACANARAECTAAVKVDPRVAECNGGRCSMIDVDRIVCGGAAASAHACPPPYGCTNVAGGTGRCRRD